VSEAVASASQFMSGGEVMLEKDASGKVHPVVLQRGGTGLDIPLVVLVNGGSASAAEIVAGALQDAHRAALVGERTFGAGTILKSFNLIDGSTLILAVKEWFTPSGAKVWHEGIQPNYPVSLPDGVSALTPQALKGMTINVVLNSSDVQLLTALEMLHQR
jgi:carboxyl-terminal processing protease